MEMFHWKITPAIAWFQVAKISSLDGSAVQHVFTSPRAFYACHDDACAMLLLMNIHKRGGPFWKNSRRDIFEAKTSFSPLETDEKIEREKERTKTERKRERIYKDTETLYKYRPTQLFARCTIRTNVKWSNGKQRRYVELTVERDVKLQRSRNLLWFRVKTRSIASGSILAIQWKTARAFGPRWKGSSMGGVEREWVKRNYGIILHARVKLTRACGKYVNIGNRTNVVSSRVASR